MIHMVELPNEDIENLTYALLEEFGVDDALDEVFGSFAQNYNSPTAREYVEITKVIQRAVAWQNVFKHSDFMLKQALVISEGADATAEKKAADLIAIHCAIIKKLREWHSVYDIKKTLIENKILNWTK